MYEEENQRPYERGIIMRLTEKFSNACGGCYEPITNDREVCDKLGQLEDFEEKLGHFGISLLIPLQALFDGIYVVNEESKIEWEPVTAIGRNMVILGFLGTVENGVRKGIYGYGYEDYGISWALTKEELE